MNGSKLSYSPRRAGEVVGVEVRDTAERPVTITCHDHAHTYEIAWRDTGDGPIITDLRVTSHAGVPITSDSLKRIRTDRLARTAAIHDTAAASTAARHLRAAFEKATGSTEGFDWLERFRFTEGVADAMIRHAPPGARLQKPSANRGGRPPLSPDFLAQVARWAREETVLGGGLYRRIADRATKSVGRDVSDETVKGWIRRCKAAGLLEPDELRRPRQPRTASTEENRP